MEAELDASLNDSLVRRAVYIDLCAGTCGGIAQTIVGHPLDTIKVRLQSQLTVSGRNTKYTGLLHCFQSIIREERVTGLFKGLLSPLTGIAALNAVLFTSYGFAKSRLEASQEEELSIYQITFCGMFAGIAQCSVCCPMELIKVRLQAQQFSYSTRNLNIGYSGNFDCIRKTVRAQGVKGLFAGMYGCLAREIPAYSTCFLAYEILQRAIAKKLECEVDSLGPASLIMAGGTAGIFCWLSSYPQDVILTRLRTQRVDQPPKYKKWMFDGGFWDCGRQIVKQEGWSALMKGFSACALRAFPANAASFVAYEFSKEYLVEHFGKSDEN